MKKVPSKRHEGSVYLSSGAITTKKVPSQILTCFVSELYSTVSSEHFWKPDSPGILMMIVLWSTQCSYFGRSRGAGRHINGYVAFVKESSR